MFLPVAGKTLKLRRSISQRNDVQGISWFLSEKFDGLGISGRGSFPNVMHKIIEARDAGYKILMQEEIGDGFTSVSLEARNAIEEALGQ